MYNIDYTGLGTLAIDGLFMRCFFKVMRQTLSANQNLTFKGSTPLHFKNCTFGRHRSNMGSLMWAFMRVAFDILAVLPSKKIFHVLTFA